MQCHVCGTEVRPEQKFCMECGARLQQHRRDDALAPPELESGPNAPVAALPPGPGSRSTAHPMFDPITGRLLAQPSPPETLEPPEPPASAESAESAESVTVADEDATNVLPALGQPQGGLDDTFAPPNPYAQGPGHWERAPGGYATPWPEPLSDDGQRDVPTSVQPGQASYGAPPSYRPEPYPLDDYGRYDATGVVPETYAPWEGEWDDVDEPPSYGPTFRIRPLLVLSILPAIAAIIGMFVELIDIAPDGDLPFGASKLNDFGTNNTVTGIIMVVTMVAGALAWCGGFRWGAGLAGGAGAGIAGWAALVIGLAEVRISQAEAAGGSGVDVTRSTGYWSLVAAGGLGMLVLLTSLLRAGNDRRAGLDPWVAALGAIATIAAVLGPLIPLNGVNLDLNWSSPAGSDLPTLFFVGRFVQLGLLLACGVFGFLLVRRYGLGLAIGGTIGVGWMVLTAATEQTDAPIGPALLNPGQDQRAVFGGIPVAEPYVVTTVGVGMMLFFGLVAAVMALIDAD